MTATPDSDAEFDAADFVRTVLDWLDRREEGAETIDRTFRLLGHHRRRHLLAVMYQYDQELTLPDAAEEVARLETDRRVAEISAERVADVYISLYHDHLPRLTRAGLLEYDQERDLVAPAAL
ncbi:DUF7344 domain-containing protein [Salinilacihabitans rarus]|uniref:DUF7344 domain-containing protein n=1 Tax=Salinilacihabitans rarus TaxID=2961596 RepID=UPI0020C8BC89|nr:hypothetical protein [Salinilacihabitans rarus]